MRSRRAIGRVLVASGLIAVAVANAPGPLAVAQAPPKGGAAGRFVWHDLVTSDAAASRAFYGALFGWTFEPGQGIDPGYTIIKHDGRPIGGIVVRQGSDTSAQWLSYVVVPDVDRSAKAFEQGGGKIFRGPLNARRDLRVAVVADGQGAPLGLASRGPEGPDDGAVPALNRWLWIEYVARDPEAALTFLSDTVGFGHEVSETRNAFTYYLLKTDRPRAGLFRSLWPRDTSAWLPYVRVSDPAATMARVVDLGGAVVLPPASHIRNGSLAIVLDPAGAPLALQKFPFESGVTP